MTTFQHAVLSDRDASSLCLSHPSVEDWSFKGDRTTSFLNLLRWCRKPLDLYKGVIIAIVGLQKGDEGKGKVVSWAIQQLLIGVGVRFQGGSNAGHELHLSDGRKVVVHLVPESVVFGGVGIIGAGCVCNPARFMEEICELADAGITVSPSNLFMDPDTTITTAWAIKEEQLANGDVMPTGTAVGPTVGSMVRRARVTAWDCVHSAISDDDTQLRAALQRVSDSFDGHLAYADIDMDAEVVRLMLFGAFLSQYASLCHTHHLVQNLLNHGVDVVYIGGQGMHLDVYRSNPTATCTPVWPPVAMPTNNMMVVGVAKQLMTASGAHALPTMMPEEDGDAAREEGCERGKTTGRAYHMSHLWIPRLREGARRCEADIIVLNKCDLATHSGPLTVYTDLGFDGQDRQWWPSERAAWDASEPNQTSGLVDVGEPTVLPAIDGAMAGVTQWDQLPVNLIHRILQLDDWLGVDCANICAVGNGPHSTDLVVQRRREDPWWWRGEREWWDLTERRAG